MKSFFRKLILAILAGIFVFPVVMAVLNAFKPLGAILRNVLNLPESFYLENFKHVIRTTNYGKAFLNTMTITVLAVGFSILLSAMCAYMLSRRGDKISNSILILFAISMLVPFQTFMLPLVKLASDLHLDDSILGLICIMVPLFCPYAILTYHGFVKTVPRELDEAAEIDGVGKLRAFFQIIFPMLRPITASLLVLYTLWAWNDFALPLVMLRSPDKKTVTLVTFVYYSAQNMRWDYILAALTMAALPVILFYVAMQKKIIGGVTAGAVKG